MTPAQFAYLIIAVIAVVAALPTFATAFAGLAAQAGKTSDAFNTMQLILSALANNAMLVAVASLIAAFIYLKLTQEL
ncbi:MAG: hypothetical protein QXI07_09610 [Pyrobaculum sp.]